MIIKNNHIDVLLITTVKEELDIVLEAESDWRPRKDINGFPYYTRRVNGCRGKDFRIAVTLPLFAGADTSVSDFAPRLIKELKPRCVSMIGICAGFQGKVSVGDVVVAERVFCYDTGKLKAFQEGRANKKEVFHNMNPYTLKPAWVQKVQNFPSDWTGTIKAVRPSEILQQPDVHLAPMGTGDPVKTNPELFPMLASHIRKVRVIDRDAVAIGAVADIETADPCIIVKTVAGDVKGEKDEHFRCYAIESSYRFLIAFLKNNLWSSEPAAPKAVPVPGKERIKKSPNIANKIPALYLKPEYFCL